MNNRLSDSSNKTIIFKTVVWGVGLIVFYLFLYNLVATRVQAIVKAREANLLAAMYPDLVHDANTTPVNRADLKPNPKTVVAGTYLERVSSYELANSTWSYEFYQWFKWDPTEIKFANRDSLKKGAVSPEDVPFRVINGNISRAVLVDFKYSKQRNLAYALYFVTATSTQNFALDAYPLDKHFLYIAIEHKTLDQGQLKFVPDLISSKVSSRIVFNGYLKGERMAFSSNHTYQSAYGDPGLNQQSTRTFNQYRFGVLIKRDSYYYYIKLFTVLIVSACMAFLSFFANKADKIRITVGALFTTAANNYILIKDIPENSSISIAEIVDVVSLVTIFWIMVDHTVFKYVTRDNEKLSNATQWTTFALTLLFYLIINISIPVIGS